MKEKVKATKRLIGKSKMTSGNEYMITISYNGNIARFAYHDNYMNKSSTEEFLYAMLMDADAYDFCYNLADFCNEFGYENESEGRQAYRACARQNGRLHRLFTDEEIEELKTEFENF